MKKVAALVLCLVLMGSLFAGCQQKPKEIPPYFPHSDSIRMDVIEQDIIDLGIPHHTGSQEGSYKSPPVSIDGVTFNLTYSPYVFGDEASVSAYYYTKADEDNEDLDVPAAYKQLEKYFNKVYGKGEKYENASEWQTDFVGRIWIFSIDNGKEYRLTLSYYHWRDDEKETAPYHLTIHISRNFKA